ncbi:unnamed protein product [Musa acuminata subsp. malaccensis]|uniref:(wild Malaysian banana) hypothetical protein n=1 Tax=Musa acuminata subsp. malaccensis TaxID=214687 RepID=A0A804HPV3_MUSAM|nr:unnamed protein product [Musa acuminata subsp. malaccensis]
MKRNACKVKLAKKYRLLHQKDMTGTQLSSLKGSITGLKGMIGTSHRWQRRL